MLLLFRRPSERKNRRRDYSVPTACFPPRVVTGGRRLPEGSLKFKPFSLGERFRLGERNVPGFNNAAVRRKGIRSGEIGHGSLATPKPAGSDASMSGVAKASGAT